MPLTERRHIHKLSKIYAIHNNQALSYLCKTLKSYQTHHVYNARRANNPNYLTYPQIEPLPLNNNIPRYSQIVIAQLRIGFSDLNSHLFNNGCVESPLCLCGNVCEDTKYFLMFCPLYDNIRTTLLTRFQQLKIHVPTNHKLLLYGNTRLTPTTNLLIQEHMSAYLIESKRFLHNHNRKN